MSLLRNRAQTDVNTLMPEMRKMALLPPKQDPELLIQFNFQ